MFVLAGWLCVSGELAVPDPARCKCPETLRSEAPQDEPTEPPPAASRPDGDAEPPDRALERMGPRALRRLPGVGQARALAIARARWETGSEGGIAALERIPGIGPETVKEIRGWLEKRRSPR
jgi:hypothetical protein